MKVRSLLILAALTSAMQAMAQPCPLLSQTNTLWRYEQDNPLDPIPWQWPFFDDGAWQQGLALLAVENNTNITPIIRTTLTLGRTTYYFRTHFNWPASPANAVLTFRCRIDDGAVLYLNGEEIQRIRMDPPPTGYSTLAIASPQPNSDAEVDDVFSITNHPALITGDNLLAVEVHQFTTNSSDIVWGCSLESPSLPPPPVITTQPQSRTVCPGSTVQFSVGATGGAGTPLTYQWQFNGANIPGATLSTYTIPNAQAANGGTYVVVVSNPCGSVSSQPATLTVNTPTTASGPTNRTVCLGASTTFTTTPSGTGPFNYQWTRNGTNIGNATGANYTIPNVSASDAGTYCVIVNGACNRVTNCASLTVNTPTTANGPTNQTACAGTDVTFRTTASGTGPFTYQWTKNGGIISGATDNTLVVVAGSGGAAGEIYCVIVTGACNNVTNCATLTVNTPTTATGPTNQTACAGRDVTLTTTASGTGPFTYRWTRNGAPISGATSSSLVVVVGSGGTTETYCIVVTGACNSVTNCATVTALSPVAATPLTSGTVPPGHTFAFSTTASGSGPFTYQWTRNGAPIPGATSSSYTATAGSAGKSATYCVIVTGACNSVTNCATLTASEACDPTCTGLDFWLTFPGNYAPDPTNPPVPCLCIRGLFGTAVQVAIPGLGFATTVFIPSTQVANVCLPKEADMGDANDIITNKAVQVTANAPISVSALNRVVYTSDGYLAMPAGTLGVDYWVLGYSNVYNGVPELAGSQFAIVACDSNTDVTITPSRPTGARTNGAYTITLQAGDVYQLRNTNNGPADLSGTHITATAPIAVFAGHACANVQSSNQFFCDYLVEQLQPTFMWGTNFLTAPLSTRANGDTFRILAAQPGTQISIDGGPGISLSVGQPWQTVLTAGARISATRPISVMQYANSSDFDGVVNADPFMVLVPPTKQFVATQEVCTATAAFANWLNIIAPAAAAASVTVDGGSPGAFTPIGTSGFSYARMSVAAGPHTVRALAPVGVTVYGWAEYESYGWPGCLLLPAAPPVLGKPRPADVLTNLTLQFSRPMSSDIADPANISFSGGLSVSRVQLLSDNRTVQVTTTPQTPGEFYTLTFGDTNKPPAHDLNCSSNTLPGVVSVTFQASTNPVPPVMVHIDHMGDQLMISWNTKGCRLQATPALGQPWTVIPGASPVALPAGGPQRFFRIICP